jgi:uncharacterized protein
VSAVYVDTSALGRVLLGEPEASAIERRLEAFDRRAASRLLGIELRRLASRRGRVTAGEHLLRRIAFVPLTDEVLRDAATIDPHTVATLDAIHLATARRLAVDGEIDAIMTFDTRLAEGARHHGIDVVAPA